MPGPVRQREQLPRWPGRAVCALALAVALGSAAAADTLATRVELAALRAATARVAAPDRFEPLSCRVAPTSSEAVGDPRLELLEIDGPNAAGMLRLRFRLFDSELPLGEVRATVRGVVRGPALVARRTLERGELIAVDAVHVADMDLTRQRRRPLRGVEELHGRVPLRTLGQGRVVAADLLRPAAVVHKGQVVDLRIERGPVSVIARGTAMRDAAPGETVAARNTATGAEVLGRVLHDGSLMVIRGAARRGTR